MLLIDCPWCGARPEIEFRHAGEAGIVRPDPVAASDADWAAFLYLRTNAKGAIAERWRHTHGCGRFFVATRDSVSDELRSTRPPGGPYDGET
jgi:sarcosine oxidase subunit delta